MARYASVLGLAALVLCASAAAADRTFVASARTEFSVDIWVDRDDCRYRIGECGIVGFSTDRDGYAYVMDIPDEGDVSVLFPNQWARDNEVKANRRYLLGTARDRYELRQEGPAGETTLKLIISREPIDVERLRTDGGRSPFPVLRFDDASRTFRARLRRDNWRDWAEDSIRITVLPEHVDGTPPPPPEDEATPPEPVTEVPDDAWDEPANTRSERFALCIGVADYRDDGITDLRFCEKDAGRMKQHFISHLGIPEEHVRLLTGCHATKQNIREQIAWLQNISDADDYCYVYFSSHGATLEDTDGDEPDGLDECFLPYDAELSNLGATVIIDDEFHQWVTAIRGQVVLLFDSCHAGGAARGLKCAIRRPRVRNGRNIRVDRWGMLERRRRDARRRSAEEPMGLSACPASSPSYETTDLTAGVFTHFLLAGLRGPADTNGDQMVSLVEAADYVKREVAEYVAEHSGIDQTPVTIPETLPAGATKIALAQER